MFTLVGGRSVAVIRPVWSYEMATGEGLYLHYRSVKSSKGIIIGPLPRSSEQPIGLQALRPLFGGRPVVIVEYEDKAMYAAKIVRALLKKWKRIDLTSYRPQPR